MYRTLSIVALSTFVQAQAWPYDSAVSPVIKNVGRAWETLAQQQQHSEILYGPTARLKALLKLAKETAIADSNMVEIDPVAFKRATDFITLIPPHESLPDISIDDEGGVRFDWQISRFKMFSLVVNRSQLISYAVLDGNESYFGANYFDGIKIPLAVVAALKSLWV